MSQIKTKPRQRRRFVARWEVDSLLASIDDPPPPHIDDPKKIRSEGQSQSGKDEVQVNLSRYIQDMAREFTKHISAPTDLRTPDARARLCVRLQNRNSRPRVHGITEAAISPKHGLKTDD